MNPTSVAPATPRLIRGVRWIRLAGHLGVGFALVGVVFPRVSSGTRARLLRWWSAKVLRILRIVLDVNGHPPDWQTRDLVIAANHISWLDIFVINAVRPTRFVAKSEIRDWPMVGWLCEKSGTIFIKRARKSDTHKINQVIHDVLAAGDCVGLFPEGTTSAGDRLRKFHSSLFEPAVASSAQVSPAAIRYRDDSGNRLIAPAYIDEITFPQSLAAILACRKIIAEITFADPLPSAGQTRRALASACESTVARILDVQVSRERLALGGALSAATESFDEN